jgi:acetolactate decarboxylase
MWDLNAAGWHFHFVSADKKTGGHVLNLSLNKGTIIWDATDNFKLHLPDGNFFKALDLTVDQDDDIKEVEQEQGE